MKLPGVNVEFKNIPALAWIIASIGILIVCIGIAASLIYRSTAVLKTPR